MAPLTWTALPLLVASAGDASPLHVPDDARSYLQSLRAPSVHVLGVTGPPNTGERLLLKTMLHADADAAAFHKAANGERVMLWLWRPSVQSDDRVRLVISVNQDEDAGKADRRRMTTALLLLLSSALLYNDDGEIDALALERLAWLRDVSASLRIKPNQDDDGVASDFHQHAPLFVWVQRNSKIKWLTDSATGDKISASQYLEQCLQEEGGFSDAVAQRNEQRMYLQSLFKQRECVALSRAVEGAAENTDEALALPRESLRSQFVEAVDKHLVDAFLSPRTGGRQLPAKKLLGRELRADQFIHVLDAYVSALNANGLPAMQVAANALVQKTVEVALAAARAEYEDAVKEPATLEDPTSTPLDSRDISVAHWRGLQRAMIGLQALQAELPEQTKKTLYADGLTSLRAEFGERLNELLEANDTNSKALCEKLLAEVLPANLEQIALQLEAKPRDSFSDGLVGLLTQYKSDLRDAVDKYKEEAAGPALYQSLVEALQAAVFESIKTYGASVLRQYQQHMRSLQEQRSEVEQELELAKTQDTNAAFSTDDHKRLYEDQLEQSTQQLTELRRVLLGELNGKKSELDRLVSDMSTMDAKHEVRVKSMESDLAWVRSRTEELEKAALAERQRLEQDVMGATEEMIVKERTFHQEERSLLAQQKDLLARVVELERELVQKKTKHVQQTFVIESELAKRVDELKQEQAEFARQLKSQAKTDTGVLKLAYQKKKAVVQSEIDRVARDIQEYEAKLKLFETVKSPRATAATSTASAGAAAAPEPPASATVVSALRTSSREFLFKSPDVLSPPGAGTATRVNRSDTDMCKTQ